MHDDLLPTAPGVDPIVAEALRNWNACASAHAYKREQSDLDHAFFLGDQWAGDLAAVRDALVAQKMPALVFNDLQQYVFNVVNEQLQNPSEIKISPERGAYAKATATVLQDLIRQIRTKHQGNIAVQAAFLDMVIGGCGYFGLGTEYVSDRSFNQRITFEAIEWDSAFLDPAAAYPTYHDANFGFRFSKLTREEFAEQYPDAKPVDALGPEIEENGWAGADYVRVAQYYYAKRVKKTLLKLQSGAEKYSDEMDPLMDYPVLGEDGQPISRELQVREIWVCKLTASEILESPRKWITKYIPIIPVMGIRGRHNGKEHIFGVLRAVRDPQVASNFMQNLQLLNIALGTKSPWLVAEGQTEDYSTMWGLANVKNYSALKYRRYDDDGRDLGTPIRNNLEPPVQGTQVAINELQQGKQRSMGIYDPSLGKEGPEELLLRIAAARWRKRGLVRGVEDRHVHFVFAIELRLDLVHLVLQNGFGGAGGVLHVFDQHVLGDFRFLDPLLAHDLALVDGGPALNFGDLGLLFLRELLDHLRKVRDHRVLLLHLHLRLREHCLRITALCCDVLRDQPVGKLIRPREIHVPRPQVRKARHHFGC